MKKQKQQPASQSRRKFLQKVGTGALIAGGSSMAGSAVAITSSNEKLACKSANCDYDVVVIGGGHAGAAAARDSMENGYKTLLLEARNRLGGRTFDTEFEGARVELGGTWIHNSQPFVWAEKERYSLEVEETPGAVAEQIFLVENGKRVQLTAEQMFEFTMGWQTYMHAAREVMPRPWDILYNREAAMAMDQLNAIAHLDQLGLTPLQTSLIKSTIRSIAHNSVDSISYLEVMRWHLCGGGFFPTFMDSIMRFKLKDGTSALIQHMLDDGKPDVRLSTPVTAIADKGDHVVIETQRGDSIRAATAICCLPMNTINNVAFTPALPKGAVQAAEQGHTGQGFKLYFKVEGDIGDVSCISPDHPLANIATYKRKSDSTILVVFGTDPESIDIYDDEALQAALNDHLPGVKLLSSMNYDWNSDPFAKGTYCSYRPGWQSRFAEDFQKDQGRILFGSSDHGEGWRGFIDGAIGAGIKAAERAKKIIS